MDNDKINFAIYGMSRCEAEETIKIEGAIKCSDMERFKRIKNYTYHNVSLWGGGSIFEFGKVFQGGGVAGADEKEVEDTIQVIVYLENYSNMTQAFYEATGIQVDSRFL